MNYLCDASTSSLIIIDMQEKLMPVIVDNAHILQRAAVLAQVARLLDVPVIGTVQQPLRLGRTLAPIGAMFEQSIEKSSFDACAEPAFLAALENGRQQLVISGCEAHVCVLQTVLGLLARRQRVKLVADAIGSRRESDKICAINRARAAGADIVSTEMVMFEWLKDSAHPRFREILKLIK